MAIESAAFLEGAVGVGQGRLEGQELREIGTAGLLLALDQEPDADGKLAEDRPVRLDRLDAKQKVSLVVVHAARVLDKENAHQFHVRWCSGFHERGHILLFHATASAESRL